MEKSGNHHFPAFRVIMNNYGYTNIPRWELKREDAINELIDDEQFKEVVLKQLNYMSIKGINLFKMQMIW